MKLEKLRLEDELRNI